MLFNSLEFLLFLPIVFCLYWIVFNSNLKVQNLLLLISSYVFYGWWDYRFLSLIFFSTIVDYCVGLKIYNSNDKKTKKSYLWISILFNLGILGFFKYFNFFIDSWIDFLGAFGYEHQSKWTLKVILPVGISFYTFQTMSYSLDIYHGKLKPTKDFILVIDLSKSAPIFIAAPPASANGKLNFCILAPTLLILLPNCFSLPCACLNPVSCKSNLNFAMNYFYVKIQKK